MKKRHTFFYHLLRPVVCLVLWVKFGYRWKVARDLPDTYLVLSNHTTDWDPLFVAASFPKMMYFVGSEHIARWKNAYKFLKFGFEPIMRYKGSTAFSTVTEMLRRLKAGGNVCLFAEGVRSWDGTNSPILPSTGKMVQRAKCGLVTYRIEGGYFVSPMWSRRLRRGPVRGAVVHVYSPEELAAMSVDEINAAIKADLHEDAYERQLAHPVPYRGKGLAEGMENLLFTCHRCGSLDSLRSEGDRVTCAHCGHSFRYTPFGMLEGTDVTTVKELADLQRRAVGDHLRDNVPYTAPAATLLRVDNHVETHLDRGAVRFDRAELVCGDTRFAADKITDMAMHGKRAVVFTTPEGYFELLVDEGSNALKFHLLWQEMRSAAVR